MTFHKRSHPAHGVVFPRVDIPIVFLTVCTKARRRWLASEDVHQLLRQVWSQARSWLVGRYVIMPDHIHLFTAPSPNALPLDNWVRFWKSQFTKIHGNLNTDGKLIIGILVCAIGHVMTRKGEYVRLNPVRHGFVDDPDDWPYPGELNELRWD